MQKNIFSSFRYMIFFIELAVLFIIIMFSSCNSQPNKRPKFTHCQVMNLKGNVCCIVEREFQSNSDKTSGQIPFLYKFNKKGNVILSIEDDEIVNNSYDDKGNHKVKKIRNMSKAERDWGEEYHHNNIYTYIKYYHNDKGFVIKEEEYFSLISLDDPISYTSYILDSNNWITKSVEYSNKDNQTGIFSDSLITYHEIKMNDDVITELIRKGEQEKRIISIYDDETKLRISKHTKDLFVFTETLNEFVKNENNELVRKTIKHDLNELIKYQYDHNNNITNMHISDSTNNLDIVYNFKYEYDENSNWIKKECYDHLYNLISYHEREIEYYPLNENNDSIDYNWENEKCPLEIKYEKEKKRKQKENFYRDFYLKESFILSLFERKMKEEYSNYRLIGSPKITLRDNDAFYINFNCREKNYGYRNENITVKITVNIEDDTFSFETVKGVLI